MPGIPLVSREANYSRDSEIRAQLSEEEQRAAEESFTVYCAPLELYNILRQRARINPTFLTRCLHYKLKEKYKKRVQLSVSTQSLFPLYILLARPVPTPNRETLRSSCYRFKRAYKLAASRGAQTGGSSRARFILPEINKLITDIKSGSLAMLLVSYADITNSTAIDLTKDHTFSPSNDVNCSMGKVPIDFLLSSREKSPSISLGERLKFMPTVSLKSCSMKLSCLDGGEKCLSFQFSHNSEAASKLQQVPVFIAAEELGTKDKSPYDLYSYNNIPTDKLSLVIRLRTGNVIFNFKYYNNMLQRTEVTEDYACPLCLLKCSSYKGLRCHLLAYHDHFNYQFMVTQDYQVVIVSPKDTVSTSEIFGKMVHPGENTFSFCHARRRKPATQNRNALQVGLLVLAKRERQNQNALQAGLVASEKPERQNQNARQVNLLASETSVPAPLGGLRGVSERKDCETDSLNAVRVSSGPGITSSGPESTSQLIPVSSSIAPITLLPFAKTRKLAIEQSDPRSQELLKRGRFYHSHKAQPMALEDVLGDDDSEDEVDDDVADLEDRRMLDDFNDVTQTEKQMMHMWNSFVRKQRVLADAHILWACEAFSGQHGQELIRTPGLRWCWNLFLIKLWNHGLLDAKTMNKCNLILEKYAEESRRQLTDRPANKK